MGQTILLLATGGTVASTATETGVEPGKSGAQLLAAIPGVGDDISVEQLAQRPSVDMDFETLDLVGQRVDAQDRADLAGVVVLHGTDTMEESAYYLDLTRTGGPPVVFTGAQRHADQPGADGPANIAAAVGAARTEAIQAAGGTYVCFNGEVHAARDVVKQHSWRVDAFGSPGKGPVGVLGPGGFEQYRELGTRTRTFSPEGPPQAIVDIVQTGLGVSAAPLERSAAASDGIVLVGTGLGNVPEPMADAVGTITQEGVPVVVVSRCHAGGVAPVYGRGGGQTLQANGAYLAGDLPAQKARIKLAVALSVGADGVERAFGSER